MKISPHFKRSEFACKCGCGFAAVDIELVTALEYVRTHFKAPVTINSGCRCIDHNRAVGGETNPPSKHTMGIAADIVVLGVHADRVADYLEQTYPDSYGVGRYNGRTHIDVRDTKARWDKR